jgi:hypothetical protein
VDPADRRGNLEAGEAIGPRSGGRQLSEVLEKTTLNLRCG